MTPSHPRKAITGNMKTTDSSQWLAWARRGMRRG